MVVGQAEGRTDRVAKAELSAGGKIMRGHLGLDKLDKVILAGAFVSYSDKESAACLGLFPDCEPASVYAVGNAAGDGARIALLNRDKRTEADEMARQVEYIELTLEPDFEKAFYQAMWLPHMEDDFPHLNHLLPEKAAKKR